MDKIIGDIVDIDLEQARRVSKAKENKKNVQSDIVQKKKDIYEEFATTYKAQVVQRSEELKAQINETKKQNEQRYDESLKNLDDIYNNKNEEWVSLIVEKCKEI